MAARDPSEEADTRDQEVRDGIGGDRPMRNKTPGVRRAILDAAAKLFAERGFGGTNLRDIAEAMGMSRPGLHYHFPTKKLILEAIVEVVTVAPERELEMSLAATTEDPEKVLRLLVRQSTLQIIENQVLFKVLDRSESDMSLETRQTNELSKKAIQKRYVEIIEHGILIGKFRPIDAHVAALTISGMRNWTAWWYRPDGRADPLEIADIVAEMALRSLLRADAERNRSDKVNDALRILGEDVSHLSALLHQVGIK